MTRKSATLSQPAAMLPTYGKEPFIVRAALPPAAKHGLALIDQDIRENGATPAEAHAMREITRIIMSSGDPAAAARQALDAIERDRSAKALKAALIELCNAAVAATGQLATVLPHSLPDGEPMRRVDRPEGDIVFLWDTEQVTAEEVLNLLHQARTGGRAGQLAEAAR